MSEYEFILDNITWSFSSIQSFDRCPYGWKLHYIDNAPQENNAFAQYGSFIHKILERFEKGELSIFELADEYVDHYAENVTYLFPKNKYCDMDRMYYDQGLEYFQEIEMLDDKYEILGVEKQINTLINGNKFVGFIDLLLKDKETGDIIVEDHKSAKLTFLKDGKISKKDERHFRDFKYQLLLYSKAVYEEYGKYPTTLKWNLFRLCRTLEVPFSLDEYNEALQWASESIDEIKQSSEFEPKPDDFFCNSLCSFRKICDQKKVMDENKKFVPY